ncbi:hypothetical protein ACJX0J_031423, partial [Zea mays]
TVSEVEEKGLGWAAWLPNLYCVAVEPLRRGLVSKRYAFEEIVIGFKTIRLCKWSFTRLFVDPEKICQEKSSTK